jgi:sec-independent protein translocase protein TatA
VNVPSIGLPELIVVLMILLVVFGGARLPQIGDVLGRAARGLKRGFSSDDRIEVSSADAGKPAAAGKPASAPKPGTKPADPEIAEAEIVDRKS